jgi:hypothetical protein
MVQVENSGKAAVELTNHDFPYLAWKITISSLSTSTLAALKIQPTTGLEYRLEGSLDGTSGEISYVFLLCFTVLLEQLRRLYIGGSIFQIPPVSDYSTCYTNPVHMRSVRQPYLYIQCTDHLLTRLVYL